MDDMKRILLLGKTFADIAFDATCSEALGDKKLDAIHTALGINRYYEKLGIREDLLDTILTKRLDMICNAKTAKQLDLIVHPKPPRYDGHKFYPSSEYSIPEEELIGWSQASLKAPLMHVAVCRYETLFRQVFGDAILDGLG